MQVCVLLLLISLLVWQGEGRARREARVARGEEERRETRRKMLQVFDPRSKKTRREKKMKDTGSTVLVPVITKPSTQKRCSNQDIKEITRTILASFHNRVGAGQDHGVN